MGELKPADAWSATNKDEYDKHYTQRLKTSDDQAKLLGNELAKAAVARFGFRNSEEAAKALIAKRDAGAALLEKWRRAYSSLQELDQLFIAV